MILVMSVDGQPVTHRVVSVAADGTFITRGDANAVNDCWSSAAVNVIGVYVGIVPLLGQVLHVGDTSDCGLRGRSGGGNDHHCRPLQAPTPAECAGMQFNMSSMAPRRRPDQRRQWQVARIRSGRQRHHLRRQRQGLPGGRRRQRHDLWTERPRLPFGERATTCSSGSNGPEILDGGDGSDTCNGGHGPTTFRSCEVTTTLSDPAPPPAAPNQPPPDPPTAEPTTSPDPAPPAPTVAPPTPEPTTSPDPAPAAPTVAPPAETPAVPTQTPSPTERFAGPP